MIIPATVTLGIMLFKAVMTNKFAIYFRYCVFVIELIAVIATIIMRVKAIFTYIDIVIVPIVYSDYVMAVFAAFITDLSVIMRAIVTIQAGTNLTTALDTKSVCADFKRFVLTFFVGRLSKIFVRRIVYTSSLRNRQNRYP